MTRTPTSPTPTLHSMTGFARLAGEAAGWRWTWELKSVNGKGLDIRLRLPAGFDALDAPTRGQLSAALARGSVNVGLTLEPASGGATATVDEVLLERYAEVAVRLAARLDLPRPSPAELMTLRGVIEGETAMDEAAREALHAAVLAGLAQAIAALKAHRAEEGARLTALLARLVDEIATARDEAEAAGAAQPAAIAARLEAQLEALLNGDKRVDADRIAQEVALIAVKADVREELDRLAAHVEQARGLLAGGGAIGRKFDFLAQELNREATTLCNKAATVPLNRAGLTLKALIDQLREQIQNLE